MDWDGLGKAQADAHAWTCPGHTLQDKALTQLQENGGSVLA